ncbi:flagellar hook-length control protein FliK [Natranaerobius trueperi]|uniref:Flagellar hook-length control protein-like C-terminal domain-containing protein n=1 Tax=Natranaerobius trueperi TaxID=759412 RepID=A0A226C3E7_9FIRM|nr:flagellar hook-length control protein FliK [Natranaerobius trueperi]OWZ84947.1 hypothetical protein CDO51_00645 [Natranaerobius trueperi]
MVNIFQNTTPTQRLKLTSLTDKVKDFFRPGSIVRAQVVKSEGNKVVLNLNNNLLQVKSEIPLKEGLWISGKVHTEPFGSTYLKLLEDPKELMIAEKTEQFIKQHNFSNESLTKGLVQTVLTLGENPTSQLITELESYFTSNMFETNDLQEIAFLHLNRLPITKKTIMMAKKILNIQENQLPSELFLIPAPEITEDNSFDTSIMKASLDNLFKIFFSSSKEQSTTISDNLNTEPFELLELTRALNATNNTNQFWGFFLLQSEQQKTPGEFYLQKFKEKNSSYYKNQSKKQDITLGISITPNNLGPLVIRAHFQDKVISFQIACEKDTTQALIQNNLSFLKDRLQKSKLTIAKIDVDKIDFSYQSYQTELAKTPLKPHGNFDYLI